MQKINQLLVPLEAGHEVDTATKYMVLPFAPPVWICMYKAALPVPVQAFRPY
jgi:hypothetical protein